MTGGRRKLCTPCIESSSHQVVIFQGPLQHGSFPTTISSAPTKIQSFLWKWRMRLVVLVQSQLSQQPRLWHRYKNFICKGTYFVAREYHALLARRTGQVSLSAWFFVGLEDPDIKLYAIVVIHHQHRVVPLTPTLSCIFKASGGGDWTMIDSAFQR